MKKPVTSTYYTLRFYKRDGWTKEILKPYVLKGDLNDTEDDLDRKRPSEAYIIPQFRCILDLDKLYQDHIGEVHRGLNDFIDYTDLEVLKMFNK